MFVHFSVFGKVFPSHIAAVQSSVLNGNRTVVYADDEWRAGVGGRIDPSVELRPYTLGIRKDFQQSIYRIESVLEEGGWYCDIDVIVLRKLPEPETFTVGLEIRDCPCAGVFGAPPGHPVTRKWLEKLSAVSEEDFLHHTDQNLLHTCLDDTCRIMPPVTFNYLSMTDFFGRVRLTEEQRRMVERESWVVHYYCKSWLSKWASKNPRRLNTERVYRTADEATLRTLAGRGDWLAGLMCKYIQ